MLSFLINQTRYQQQQKANLQDDVAVVVDECKPLNKFLLLLPELDDDEVLITLADDDVV